MNHRAITQNMVDLAMEYGEIDGDKIVLNSKACRQAIAGLKAAQKKLEHADKKGGITLVCDEGFLITTYRANSFSATCGKKVRA
jgi:hypothetical protein